MGATMRTIRITVLAGTALASAISVQSAIAADLGFKAPPPPPPFISRWDGLYASFSAGGTWTKVNESLAETTFQHFDQSQSFNFPFVTIDRQTINDQTSNTVDSQTGKVAGGVFTFTMGYNVVWSGWLAGIQSEVSLNRNNTRLQGSSLNTSNGTGTFFDRFGACNPACAFSITGANTQTLFSNVENKWTISEMARIGYLVTPDWLVYGLVGWSWGGFDFTSVNQSPNGNGGPTTLVFTNPFTLSGFTYGAGMEKDFGWLRAFVQYKGINYDPKGTGFSAPASSAGNASLNFCGGQPGCTVQQNATDSAVRRFSADIQQITAGITIPINFGR